MTHLTTEWSRMIPDCEWEIYRKVLQEAQRSRIPFALGGAFAVAAYTGSWRNTKDLDLYVMPQERDRMIEVLTANGFTDYFSVLPYDRWWIYRGLINEGTIVDIIWAAANHRVQIDQRWMNGPQLEVRGLRLRVIPVEVMLHDKLYIMQRERCDWPDVLNLLYFAGSWMNWEAVIEDMGENTPLLRGVLSVFQWIAPGKAHALPSWIWQRVKLDPPAPEPAAEIVRSRVELLDRRPWFGPDRERQKNAA